MANYAQADIDALRAAVKQGVSSVSYADRTVTYRSLDEMRKLLAEMENAVNAPKRVRRIASNKGF